jgi:hypothetical protein
MKQRRHRTFRERFEQKIHRTKGCWLWQASTRGGYGQIAIGRSPTGAHRVAYELYIGPIPQGAKVGHLCDNRNCVNPAHLTLGVPHISITHGTPLRIRREIAQRWVAGVPAKQLAAELGVCPTIVYKYSHGLQNRRSKIMEADADAIRQAYQAGNVTQQQLADRYNLHYSTISLIVSGKRRQKGCCGRGPDLRRRQAKERKVA